MNLNQFRKQWDLLAHRGHYSQMRAFDTKAGKMVGHLLTASYADAVKFLKAWNGKANVFIGQNPRDAQGLVSGISAISFDFDPERPKGEASTDEQLKETLKATQAVNQRYFDGQACVGISGNGCLLLMPFGEVIESDRAKFDGFGAEVPNQIKAFATQIREEVLKGSYPNVRLDSTHDAARLVKCMGSTSTKGDPRLWREARWIGVPVLPARRREFWARLGQGATPQPERVLPPVVHVDLDRSKADYALAASCKQRGFTPEETYSALEQFAAREGRTDDYRRIVSKLYANGQLPDSGVSGLQLSVPDWTDYLKHLDGGADPTIRIRTGFQDLDSALGELPRGEIAVFACRTGHGKTSFACQLSSNLRTASKRVLFFTTEMERHRIFDRLFGQSLNIAEIEFKGGGLSKQSRDLIERNRHVIDAAFVLVCDHQQPTQEQTIALIEQIKPDVFIFDHINRIGISRDVIANYVKALKNVARSLQCVGVVMAQLNEPGRGQDGKEIASVRGDVRGCQEIIHEAAVFVLWQKSGLPKGRMQDVVIQIEKSRYGGTGEVLKYKFDRVVGKFL